MKHRQVKGNEMENVLEFYIKHSFGNERIYPANKVARIFRSIAGTETLATSDLTAAKALGFTVSHVPIPTDLKF